MVLLGILFFQLGCLDWQLLVQVFAPLDNDWDLFVDLLFFEFKQVELFFDWKYFVSQILLFFQLAVVVANSAYKVVEHSEAEGVEIVGIVYNEGGFYFPNKGRTEVEPINVLETLLEEVVVA